MDVLVDLMPAQNDIINLEGIQTVLVGDLLSFFFGKDRVTRVDQVVGADGANSAVKQIYKFKSRHHSDKKDWAMGIAFEDVEGWVPRTPALCTCITVSQNRFLFNANRQGRRGYINVRLTQREYQQLTSAAGGPCKFALPCVLYDAFKRKSPAAIPIYETLPEIRALVAEALRLFGVPSHLPTSIVACELDPQYVDQFWLDGIHRRGVCLVGDAAMSHHFWPGHRKLPSERAFRTQVDHSMINTSETFKVEGLFVSRFATILHLHERVLFNPFESPFHPLP